MPCSELYGTKHTCGKSRYMQVKYSHRKVNLKEKKEIFEKNDLKRCGKKGNPRSLLSSLLLGLQTVQPL